MNNNHSHYPFEDPLYNQNDANQNPNTPDMNQQASQQSSDAAGSGTNWQANASGASSSSYDAQSQQQTPYEYTWAYETAHPNGDPTGNQPPRKNKKRNKATKICGAIVAFVLVAAISASSALLIYDPSILTNSGNQGSVSSQSGGGNTPQLEIDETVNTADDSSIQSIARTVRPAVVGIVTYMKSQPFQAYGSGSGIIMSTDGYIITNAHVLFVNNDTAVADIIKVVLSDESEYTAEIVGIDKKTDLAVVKIDGASGLVRAEFGDSDALEIGEDVIAIGNPGGLSGTVTKGIVSALDRPVKTSSSDQNMYCIQTDAAINPGNSGGALVNSSGQVIGINSSKLVATGYEGIGFAIPIKTAKPIIDDLIANGYVKNRARLGITYKPISLAVADVYDVVPGLLVVEVDSESDVAKKGIQYGDIITAFDGETLSNDEDVSDFMSTKKPGDTVKLSVFRQTSNGQNSTFDVNVTLMEDTASDYTTGTEEENNSNNLF